MDELTQKALNEVPEPVTEQTESPTVETNDTEVQTEDETTVESKEEETVEQPNLEEEKLPKKGAESRIRELNSQVKKERAEKESLAQRVQQLTGSVEPHYIQNGYNPNVPLVSPGEEVTQEELQRRVAQRDQWLLQQSRNETAFMLQREKVLNRIQQESSEAEKAYPQLNPDSGEYDEELANSISNATLAFVKTNPASSLKNFVDSLMKPYLRSLDKSVASKQGEIIKQASQTAMRPSQVSASEKKPEDMTTEELEAKLGVIY